MTEQPSTSPALRGSGAPVYLAGLLLAGRRVVAVGGGHVHARRVPKLLASGADVVVVAPRLHPGLAALAASGQITWHERGFEETDLDGAWYVLAATDDPEVNAQVGAAAEARHTFCVRADRGEAGSAWTPATAAVPGATIAVQASHDPKHARALRDRLVELLDDAGE
jgi:sirohydrochlorin cobaltochelatase